MIGVFRRQESRQGSKKQQKVSQNHEHITCAQENEMETNVEPDRHWINLTISPNPSLEMELIKCWIWVGDEGSTRKW